MILLYVQTARLTQHGQNSLQSLGQVYTECLPSTSTWRHSMAMAFNAHPKDTPQTIQWDWLGTSIG